MPSNIKLTRALMCLAVRLRGHVVFANEHTAEVTLLVEAAREGDGSDGIAGIA